MTEPKADETGTGEETEVERAVSNNLGVVIHFFLSALAVLLLIAAAAPRMIRSSANFPRSGRAKTNTRFCKKLSKIFC